MAQELADLPDDPAAGRPSKTRLEIRKSLAKSLGIKLPRKAKKGPMEIAARNASFIDKTPEEIAVLTGKLAKAATVSAFASLRAIRDLQAVVDVNTGALHRIQEELGQVRRATARMDRPLSIIETQDNPELNPNLAGNVPFNDADTMLQFLRSVERSTALQRYIWVQVKWSASTFTSKMVRSIFTYAFREKYDWPGGLRYRGKLYLPDKIKRFLLNVTSFVANKSGGHFDIGNAERQLRILFQDSQVTKEINQDNQRQAALRDAARADRKRSAGAMEADDEEPTPRKKEKRSSRAKPKHKEDKQRKQDEGKKDDDEPSEEAA